MQVYGPDYDVNHNTIGRFTGLFDKKQGKKSMSVITFP